MEQLMKTAPSNYTQASQIHQEVDGRFGDFLNFEINADAAERDEQARPLSREIFKEAGRLGLMGYSLPTDVGGEGRNLAEWGFALERIGIICHDLSFTLLLGLYTAVAEAIHSAGRPDLDERYVRPIIRGDKLISFAYTENADAFNFQSTAQKIGDQYLLNGRKVMVTGGAMADAFMTFVRDEQDDLKVFIIERDDPGVSVTPISVMGFRSVGLVALEFNQTLLGEDRLLAAHDGLSHAQNFLNRRRVILSCAPMGRMHGLIKGCIEHVSSTERYDRPLSTMQSVQSKIGQMYILAETARTVVYEGLSRLESGDFDPYWDPFLSMTKYDVVDKSIRVAQAAVGLVGGAAYMKDRPFERNLRDFIGLIPGAGSQNILEADLGQHIINQIELADLLN